jgi:2-dehydro-3-deoxyphosphogluconate aldolase/(4S)-4-hydroxy-2-oxoglutarate aldolase
MLAAGRGADFLVSFVYTLSLTGAAAAQNMQLLPGESSHSDVILLRKSGINHMKFLPTVGAAMLKLIIGPLPQVPFCPTGGSI